MFRELVQYGEQLEGRNALPPIGFYAYGAPIHWVVHLRPSEAFLEKTELNIPRPYSGRTGNTEAHLLTDEAGYVFGLPDEKKQSTDAKVIKRSKEKLENFKQLIREFLESKTLKDKALKEAIELLLETLESERVQTDARFQEITSKQWISFQTDAGALAGLNLFEHEDAKRFWVEEMQRRTVNATPVFGECATCGKHRQLVYKIPLGVKLVGVTPLHSLNKDAFVSFRQKSEDSNIGICYQCADTASRAFNYLSGSEQHKRTLIFNSNKRDGLENQIALFWASTPGTATPEVQIGQQSLDADTLIAELALAIAEERPVEGKQRAEIAQLAQLLDSKWLIKDGVLQLSDIDFNLGILSPNVGRIALREWITVSLEQLKNNYAKYFKSARIVSSWGDNPKPFSVSTLVNAVESSNPNLSRSLLRTLMLGYDPPRDILERGVQAFRNPNVFNDQKHTKPLERAIARRLQQQLMSGIKLFLFYSKGEDMSELDPRYKTPAYLCGRLLSVLEEAQQRASGFSLNTTLVDRFYGAASTAPGTVFGNLLRLATIAHLSKAEVSNAILRFPGEDNPPRLGELLENIVAALSDVGGFPKTLTNLQQGEFALGFYQQRAAIRTTRPRKNKDEGAEQ